MYKGMGQYTTVALVVKTYGANLDYNQGLELSFGVTWALQIIK